MRYALHFQSTISRQYILSKVNLECECKNWKYLNGARMDQRVAGWVVLRARGKQRKSEDETNETFIPLAKRMWTSESAKRRAGERKSFRISIDKSVHLDKRTNYTFERMENSLLNPMLAQIKHWRVLALAHSLRYCAHTKLAIVEFELI